MAAFVTESCQYNNISATGLVHSGPGSLLGIFVASASASPTIKVWDAISAAAPILVNTFTPVPATFYPIPAVFGNGIFVTIGGTVDCTVFWTP